MTASIPGMSHLHCKAYSGLHGVETTASEMSGPELSGVTQADLDVSSEPIFTASNKYHHKNPAKPGPCERLMGGIKTDCCLGDNSLH